MAGRHASCPASGDSTTGPVRVESVTTRGHEPMDAQVEIAGRALWKKDGTQATPEPWRSHAERFCAELETRVTAFVAQLRESAEAHTRAAVDRARAETLATSRTHAPRFAPEVETTAAMRAAVERIRCELEQDCLDRLLLARLEHERSQAAEVARIRQESAQLLATEVARAKAEAEEAHARHPARLGAEHGAAPAAARQAGEGEGGLTLATMNRVLQIVRRLDDARSLVDVLDTLSDALEDEAARVAVLMVQDGRPQTWRLQGFADHTSASRPDPSTNELVTRAIATGETCFAQVEGAAPHRALAVPIPVSGGVAAVVYADNHDRGAADQSAWAEVIEILVRHAGRTVEAFSAVAAPARGTDPSSGAGGAQGQDGASVPSERRRAVRHAGVDLPWVGGARLLPGRSVTLVNLSEAGALVESDVRLVPETRVVLHLTGTTTESRVPARVVRCAAITTTDPAGRPRYRGAVAFTEPMREMQRGPHTALTIR
jgi:hypothetical protein